MKDNLILEGKTYISARQAAKIMNYAQDYIGQLCRTGKVDARMVGRSWFVTAESLFAHRASTVEGLSEKIPFKNPTPVESQPQSAPVSVPTVVAPVAVSLPLVIAAPVISPLVQGVSEIISKGKEENKLNLSNELKKLILTKKTEVAISPEKKVGANTSLFKYESVASPMMPQLEKKVPAHFSVPKLAPAAVFFDTRKSFSMNTAVIVIVASSILFTTSIFGISIFSFNHSSGITSRLSLSGAMSATGKLTLNILEKVGDGFTTIANYVSAPAAPSVSNVPVKPIAIAPTATAIDSQNVVSLNGMAVSPFSNSSSTDEALKEKIKNTFSDSVDVHADNTGVSGVIKPVFKNADGNNFVYVLVPVKDQKQDQKQDQKEEKKPATTTQN